jgi:hypothetical protein
MAENERPSPVEAADIAASRGLSVSDALAIRTMAQTKAEAEAIADRFAKAADDKLTDDLDYDGLADSIKGVGR